MTDTKYRIFTIIIAIWLTVVIAAGFLMDIPRIPILEHTARNLYFHVPMWFTMMAGGFVSAWHAIRFLGTHEIERDIRSEQAALVTMYFGIMGLITGMVWSRFTWYVGTGKWWSFAEPKPTFAAVMLLIYGAYFVLRSSFENNPRTRARISAVYNLFAASVMPILLYILPRQMKSLHPGAEGNPAFSQITYWKMRLIFYPAIIGFIALFWWLYNQRVRIVTMQRKLDDEFEL